MQCPLGTGKTGCGKTELCATFASAGFAVLDEGFLDMPCPSAHPQSLVMEAAWVSAWFQRVLAAHEQDPARVMIADRSPLSAVFYTRAGQGALLDPLIRGMYADLAEAGVEIYTVYLQVKPATLWSRIQRRLLNEPDRVLYKEDSREWMETVLSFYEQYNNWDFVIDNSVDDRASALSDVMMEVIKGVESRSPRFRDHVSRKTWSAVSPPPRFALDNGSTNKPSPAPGVAISATQPIALALADA